MYIVARLAIGEHCAGAKGNVEFGRAQLQACDVSKIRQPDRDSRRADFMLDGIGIRCGGAVAGLSLLRRCWTGCKGRKPSNQRSPGYPHVDEPFLTSRTLGELTARVCYLHTHSDVAIVTLKNCVMVGRLTLTILALIGTINVPRPTAKRICQQLLWEIFN